MVSEGSVELDREELAEEGILVGLEIMSGVVCAVQG